MSTTLSGLEVSAERMREAFLLLVAGVSRQLAMPAPEDERLDAVAFQLAKIERLHAQAARLVKVASGKGGAAVVVREALGRRLRALGAAAQALAGDAETLAVRG